MSYNKPSENEELIMRKTSKLFVALLLFGLLTSGCSLMPTAGSRRSKKSSEESQEVVDNFDAKTHEIYELYLANGGTLTYEEWLESIKGAKGDKGDKGDTGATGATGAQGPKGDKGDQGDPGQDGKDGVDGQDGKDGVDGQNGVDGKDGTDGTTPHIGNNGNWWIGEQDTGVCAGGQNGEPGVGISSIAFNGEGELVVTFDDGSVVNLGVIGSNLHQHEYEVETLEATCTTDGYYKFTCKTCGHIETVINKAQGHNFDAYRDRVAPTCTSEGVKFRRCLTCGYEETEIIPAHDHEFSENCVFDANKHWHYCVTCGVISDEASHLFVDNVCSVCNFTKSNKSSEGILYGLNDDNVSYTLITVGNCLDSVIDIPSTYNGYPVTAISSGAFQGDTEITSITMPDTITTIGARAFYGCSNLQSVCLSNSLNEIPNDCFRESKLASIVIPNGVTRISDYAFLNCRSLSSVIISDTVTYIGYQSFGSCSCLENIVIPGSVSNIYGYSFCSCGSLTNVVLNDGLKNLGWRTFDYCTSLQSITIPASVCTIGDNTFNSCSSLTSVCFEQPDGWYSGSENIYKEILSDPELAAKAMKNNNSSLTCKLVASTLSSMGALILNVTEQQTILTALYPTTAISPISFESLDESVAVVDENGIVTGVGYGNTSIILKSAGLKSVVDVIVGFGEAKYIFEPNKIPYPYLQNNGEIATFSCGNFDWESDGRAYASNSFGVNSIYTNGGTIRNLTEISNAKKIIVSYICDPENRFSVSNGLKLYAIDSSSNKTLVTCVQEGCYLITGGIELVGYTNKGSVVVNLTYTIPDNCSNFVFDFSNQWSHLAQIAFY